MASEAGPKTHIWSKANLELETRFQILHTTLHYPLKLKSLVFLEQMYQDPKVLIVGVE
jgi:hypothetical protein